jgi:hypothetical protein
MVKAARKIIKTLDDAIAAYRGELRFRRAFKISRKELAQWRAVGVPPARRLRLYRGLLAMDCDVKDLRSAPTSK